MNDFKNGDILIGNTGQVFIIINVNCYKNNYIKALGLVDNNIKEVFLLIENLSLYKNITEELKLINNFYNKHFGNNYINLEINNKIIKLDLKSAISKLNELKEDFNNIKEESIIELENEC